jgi:hypothetical protein
MADLFDNQDFRAFLYQLRIDPDAVSESVLNKQEATDVSLFLLQGADDHDAFYRLDLVDAMPHLRVIVATHQDPMRFEIYWVQLGPLHPLASLFRLFEGSHDIPSLKEQRTEDQVAQAVLFAIGESMKQSFWAGWPTKRFPPEIEVQKLT